MSNDGVLVSRKWLERANVKLFGNKDIDDDGQVDGGLFYDVRPARLQSAWTQNAANVWTATACFVVNDVADTSFVFPVYAPTATSSPGGTAETTRFFVVWRGRWELIAGAGQSQTYDTVSVIKSVSNSLLSDATQTAGYIPVIVDATAISGSLVFTFGYLHLSQTTSTVSVLKAPTS